MKSCLGRCGLTKSTDVEEHRIDCFPPGMIGSTNFFLYSSQHCFRHRSLDFNSRCVFKTVNAEASGGSTGGDIEKKSQALFSFFFHDTQKLRQFHTAKACSDERLRSEHADHESGCVGHESLCRNHDCMQL